MCAAQGSTVCSVAAQIKFMCSLCSNWMTGQLPESCCSCVRLRFDAAVMEMTVKSLSGMRSSMKHPCMAKAVFASHLILVHASQKTAPAFSLFTLQAHYSRPRAQPPVVHVVFRASNIGCTLQLLMCQSYPSVLAGMHAFAQLCFVSARRQWYLRLWLNLPVARYVSYNMLLLSWMFQQIAYALRTAS